MSALLGDSMAARLRRWALDALERHHAEGTLPTSLRHLFYEAVMAGVIDKGDPRGSRPHWAAARHGSGRRPDQNLADAVTWLRENGVVPWSWIEDRTRHLVDHRGEATTVVDALGELLDDVRTDVWGEPTAILVAESESIAGVLQRITYQYRTVIVPTKGQSNGWLRTTVAERLGGRPVAVGYLGDADKAGVDIEANRRVLGEVLTIKDWRRLALTWAQVDEHALPTVDRTDGRNRQTYEVCEIEALPQRILNDEVTSFLDGWLDADLEDVQVREESERAEIRRQFGFGDVP